jgi:glycosyltransferase involved in cell wall biosynthesis
MRIAFAHYSSVDDISGVTSWLIQLALYLKGEGCSVAIVLLDLCEPGDTSPLEHALRQGGIEVFKSPPTGSLRRDVDVTLAFLNTWRPDVFLPQCKPHHYIAAAIAGRAGLPWVFTIQSDDPDYWAVIDSFPPSRHGGRIVAVSRHIKAALEERADEINCMVIPPGVAIPSATAQGTWDSFEVIYCGRLWEHQKRASLVTETLIQACRRGEGRIHATVIGDGYSREACEQMVREADLGEHIQFSGRLSSADLQNVLIHSQAILLMSDFEGLPVALLMAMAAGVVPVVRAIPSGIPEVVHHGQTGLLVNDDPAQAAEALLQLAADPPLWTRCSSAARALVRDHYGEKACHQQWLDLLTVMASASRPAYPISGWHGVRLGMLSPLLTAGYRKQPLWRRLRLSERLRTGLARSKGAFKKRLGL